MKSRRVKPPAFGATLLEVVVGVGLLAVVIPLVTGAMLQSGLSSRDAKAETRSVWMVPLCLDEWSRHQADENLDGPESALMLAFDHHGGLLGAVDREQYESGVKVLNSDLVFYLARVEKRPLGENVGDFLLNITVEYPSVLAVSRRSVVSFEKREM